MFKLQTPAIQNSKSEKRRKKIIRGPVGWKHPGPHPRFFPPPPHAACFGALFAIIPIVNYLKPRDFQGKKMVKRLPVPLTLF
jgi:hypothetical protein